MKRSAILAVAVLLAFSLGAGAAEEKQSTVGLAPLYLANDGPSSNPIIIQQGEKGDPSLLFDLDITSTESWDLQADPDNVVMLLDLGAGGVMTGVGWDVNVSTVGASWLSEATINFDNTDQVGGINLSVGVGNDAPGVMNFTSPVVDFTDNALPDIVVGADEMLRMEFFESFDDVADAIDAFYDDSSGSPVVGGPASTLTLALIPGPGNEVEGGGDDNEIPTLSSAALVGLVLMLAGMGVFLMRRRNLTNLS